MLTDAHLARARDLRARDVRAVGEGCTSSWRRIWNPGSPYQNRTAVLAAAREDFGDAILRRDG